MPILQILEVIEIRYSLHPRIAEKRRGLDIENFAVIIVTQDRSAEASLTHPLGVEDESRIVLGHRLAVQIAESPNGLLFAADTDKEAVVVFLEGPGIADIQTGIVNLLQHMPRKNTMVKMSRRVHICTDMSVTYLVTHKHTVADLKIRAAAERDSAKSRNSHAIFNKYILCTVSAETALSVAAPVVVENTADNDIGAMLGDNTAGIRETAVAKVVNDPHIVKLQIMFAALEYPLMKVPASVNDDFAAGGSGNGQPFSLVPCGKDTDRLFLVAAPDQHRIPGAGMFNGGTDSGKGFVPA